MLDLKRHSIFVTLLAIVALFPVTVAAAAEGPEPPQNLRAEYLTNPLGIDVRQPRFAWVDEHTARAEQQTAYQLLVATSPDTLAQDHGDAWDSGKVTSGDSTQVTYNGNALESGRAYYWKVRYWDKEGNTSAYSPAAQFEMALLSRDEWKGQWIGGANQLRTGFDLSSSVVRARAYVAGVGYYELHTNGEKIGDKVLDPAWTTYDKRVLYSTYDVTAHLKRGPNAVGLMLGEGWYHGRALLFQLNIELAGGKHVSIFSSTAWKAKNGPITSDSVWNGETYDARLETPGWDRPGFDDSGWSPAQGVTGPQGELSAEMMPAIRVVDEIVPVAMTNPRPGVYVYDMGQNMSGWARLRVSGPRGATVRLRFAELVYPDGMINRENIRAAKSRDTYTLSGEGVETWEPRFTYHGFRYVEVSGFPGTPSLDSIRGRVVHTAVEETGSFAASKPILNQIQRLIYWSQQTNLFGIPTDCDQRNERQGWMGDAQVTAEEAMLNFDMAAFYTNFLRDIHDAQHPDGAVPDTVPHIYGRYPADPAWSTAYPLIAWYMWEQYGDKRILQEHYDGIKKWVELLRSRAADNVLGYSYYGDWVAVEPTPGALVSDAYYYYDTLLLSKMAQILGNSGDAQAYSQLASQIKDAFNRKFYDAATGSYANGSQTANALALFLDLVPDHERGHVMSHLTNDIVYQHNTHVTTGFIGVKYLLPVLSRYGRADLAYELATQTTYPSWGYMLANGATTLWELWQKKTGPSMNSQDHAMFGSLGAWFYQSLAGINIDGDDPAAVGYGRVRIEPEVVEDLDDASATVDTVRGRIASSWTHRPGVITLDVTIPVSSQAKVTVPKEQEMTEVTISEGEHIVWQDGHFVSGAPGVTGAALVHGNLTLDVGSGYYSFKLVGQ